MPLPTQIELVLEKYNHVFNSMIPSRDQLEVISVNPVSDRRTHNAVAAVRITKTIRTQDEYGDVVFEQKVSDKNIRVYRENLYSILYEKTEGFALTIYASKFQQPGMLEEVLEYLFMDFQIRLEPVDVFLQHDGGQNYKLVARKESMGWTGFFPLRILPS